ncbi:MAG: TIR domain-containing protein [Pseudonocardiaceae bacterium]
MARVFISYASEDREGAARLHQWLTAADHEVFLAQDLRDGIVGGEQWRPQLHERLRWADAVVCILTSSYVASIWCTAEIAIAQSRGSRLVPVVAESGVVHPLLNDIQHIDPTRDPAGAPAALDEALRRVDAAGGFGWPDDRSPYPGLRPLGVAQHRVFFGRAGDTEELAELLRSPAEQAKAAALLVVGPSGCGKSSLIRAGLLHVMALEPGWRILPPILPGADPSAALARELAAAARRSGLGWTVGHVHRRLAEGNLTGLADELLLANPGGPGSHLLIVVDQFEELLTQAGSGERARFAELLRPALSGPVQVVATLRPEFVDQLLIDTDLAVLSTSTYLLRPLRRETLPAVIKGPAELAGIRVDDELVARLVADTDSGEALPLLAFTLAQLAEGVGRGGHFSAARYEQLGGVQGALTRQADVALADASKASGRGRGEVITGLLRLVTVDEQGRPTRWRVCRNDLPDPVIHELDVFVGRRLVTTDTESDSVVMGVAHEAFLSAWPPLAQAIEDNVSALRASRAVEQAATEWHQDDRPSSRLWERGQLAAALADTGARPGAHDLVTDHVDLSPTARAFLRAGIRRDRVRRGRAITVLSMLLVLAVVAAGFAFVQGRAAVAQRNIAVSQQVAGQATELRATNSALAAQLGLATYRLVPTLEARGSLLSTFATPYATRLTDHTNTVVTVAFSLERGILATGSEDMTVQLWDVSAPHRPSRQGTLTGYSGGGYSVAFSPDGHRLITAGADGIASLWDVRDPRLPTRLGSLVGHSGAVRSVAFSPDGRTLATASEDKTARLWDVNDPHRPTPLDILPGHTNVVFSVAFSPDGNTLATAGDASAEGTVRLWDIRDPAHTTLLSTLTEYIKNIRIEYTNSVRSVTFSPDGRTLVTGSSDITVRLWDVSDPPNPTPLQTFLGHTNAVYTVTFSPDGHTLATAGFDRTVRLWDIPGPIVVGHTDTVFAVAFSPDGNTLVTGSDDNTARLWNVSDPYRPIPLSTLAGHSGRVKGVAFSPDGRTVATASDDMTVRLWDVSAPYRPSALSALIGLTTDVKAVTFSPDGRTVATGSDANKAQLWDVSDLHRPSLLSTILHDNTVWSVTFSPDGHRLITASADGHARLWDVGAAHDPRPLADFTDHTGTVRSAVFDPTDGNMLITADADGTVRLRDVSDPRRSSVLSTLTGHTGTVYSVAFRPDGRTVATASYDRTARLWDVSNPRFPLLLGILRGHTDVIFSVAFSPDGNTVATAGADLTARLWEIDADGVADRICRITPSLTQQEWDRYLPELPYQPPCPSAA